MQTAQARLFRNFDAAPVPSGLLAQFFPRQFDEVIAKRLTPDAERLVFRQIQYVLETYDA